MKREGREKNRYIMTKGGKVIIVYTSNDS